MEQLFYFLNSVYPLSPALQLHLQKVVKFKAVSKKTYLLKAGHICRNMCFITKGLLRAYYEKKDLEISSWFLKEGDFIVSIESFYNQKPSYEYIQALEDTEFFYIDYYDLEFIYQNFIEFNFIGRVLTIKYLELWVRQLYSIRNQTAQERYQWLLEHHSELVLRVPGKHLAAYLDINEATLSKIKNKNARYGLIS